MVLSFRYLVLYSLPPVLLAWSVYQIKPKFLFRSSSSQDEKLPLLNSSEQNESYDWSQILNQKSSSWNDLSSLLEESPSQSSSAADDNDFTVVYHIIILVHGWMGNSKEMDGINESLQQSIMKAMDENNNTTTDNKLLDHRFIIHSAICNEGKTNDGIEKGGARLASEINSLMEYIYDKSKNSHSSNNKITLSICGNSLGGLYARRALADIAWKIKEGNYNNNDNNDDDEENTKTTTTNDNDIIPMLFVTTATPHLGVSQHTYLPIPRMLEYPIATALQQTGRDLFCYSTVIKELTYNFKYLRPLANFQQRIAMVNVYGTDFQVPTATAGFWVPNSDSIHYRIDPISLTQLEDENDKENQDTRNSATSTATTIPSFVPPNMIVMALKTPQRLPWNEKDEINGIHEQVSSSTVSSIDDKDPYIRYREWSEQLNRLGWTKVLVDVREHVPSVSLWTSSSSSDNDDQESNDYPINGEDNHHHTFSTNNKNSWTADELLNEFGDGLFASTPTIRKSRFAIPRIRIPLGHTVMIANAKDSVNKWLTSGGKPVMDFLSTAMIQKLTGFTSSSVTSNEDITDKQGNRRKEVTQQQQQQQ